MLCYGMDFFLIGTQINKMSWQVLDLWISLFLVLIAFVLLFLNSRRNYVTAIKRSLSSRLNFYLAISFSLGAIAFYIGSHRAANIIIPTVLSSCAPLVASVLGAIYDKEKIGPLKRAGAVIIVVGIIILNVS
jgi:drug/metabolite transporter (DMT)-like permease